MRNGMSKMAGNPTGIYIVVTGHKRCQILHAGENPNISVVLYIECSDFQKLREKVQKSLKKGLQSSSMCVIIQLPGTHKSNRETNRREAERVQATGKHFPMHLDNFIATGQGFGG